MHWGHSHQLNWSQLFPSWLGRRWYYGDVGDITKRTFPYHRMRPSSIAVPLTGTRPRHLRWYGNQALDKLIYFHLRDFLSGKSGIVSIDSDGDRSSALQLKNIKKGKYHRVFNYYNTYNRLELLNETVIVWPGNSKTAPVGRPKCGFDNEFCSSTADEEGELLFCQC